MEIDAVATHGQHCCWCRVRAPSDLIKSGHRSVASTRAVFMTARLRALREPTLDSSKANVRFSFQGPRQFGFRRGLLGEANLSQILNPVNLFLSSPGSFFPGLVGGVETAFRAADSFESARFLAPNLSGFRYPNQVPRGATISSRGRSVRQGPSCFFLTELNRLGWGSKGTDQMIRPF